MDISLVPEFHCSLFAESGRASSEIRSGCKNSKKTWWMTEFLNAKTLTPVLLMNHLQSLHLRDVWCCVTLISIKTVIARSVRGLKLQRPRAEDARAEPYFMLKILVTRQQQITRFSVKIVNLETITDMLSWCRTWPPNGSRRIRAKQKHPRKHKKKELVKFIGAR